MSEIAAIILAAGGSARLGRPKPLLRWRGKALVRRSVDAAGSAGCAPIVVITGATPAVAQELQGTSVTCLHNEDWRRGPGTSIRRGITFLQRHFPAVKGTVILLCDQPLVDAETILSLVHLYWHSGLSIAACRYADTVGVPALFDRQWFPALASLPDQAGAKSLIATRLEFTALCECPSAAFDLDTEQDWQRLQQLVDPVALQG